MHRMQAEDFRYTVTGLMKIVHVDVREMAFIISNIMTWGKLIIKFPFCRSKSSGSSSDVGPKKIDYLKNSNKQYHNLRGINNSISHCKGKRGGNSVDVSYHENWSSWRKLRRQRRHFPLAWAIRKTYDLKVFGILGDCSINRTTDK